MRGVLTAGGRPCYNKYMVKRCGGPVHSALLVEGTKVCRRCGIRKSTMLFKYNYDRGWVDSSCKECRNRTSAASRRKLYAQNPCRRAYRVIHQNRRRPGRSIEWELTYDQFAPMWASPCAYCGGKSSGLDRVDNSKGYLLKNVVPCCKMCNTAKNSESVRKFEEWALRLASAILARKRRARRSSK